MICKILDSISSIIYRKKKDLRTYPTSAERSLDKALLDLEQFLEEQNRIMEIAAMETNNVPLCQCQGCKDSRDVEAFKKRLIEREKTGNLL
jgi:hypothetical protein